jgi:hypothetical protein
MSLTSPKANVQAIKYALAAQGELNHVNVQIVVDYLEKLHHQLLIACATIGGGNVQQASNHLLQVANNYWGAETLPVLNTIR